MRTLIVYNFGEFAGRLYELEKGERYCFAYDEFYQGPPISLTMPIQQKEFLFSEFPPFFDGLLPEGHQLDNLILITKTNRNDHFEHLAIVGKDLVGSVTVEEEL